MVTGHPPFDCEDQNEMFEQIKTKPFKMQGTCTDQCKAIVEALLNKNPKERLGSKVTSEIS